MGFIQMPTLIDGSERLGPWAETESRVESWLSRKGDWWRLLR